ncbi:MAG: DinB family protein [Acidimicrobiales bacterium]
MTHCEGCGFVYEDLATTAVPERLRSFGSLFRRPVIDVDPATVSTPAEPNTWSALEYLCHFRDVLLVQRERVVLARVEQRPTFARMYREERVALCGYSAHPVTAVVDQLTMAAELCATAFAALDASAWDRRFLYNWPSTAEQDLAWLGRHTVHEGEHHLMDVVRVLEAVAGRPRGA